MPDSNPLRGAVTPGSGAAPDLNRAFVRATSDFFLTAAEVAGELAGGDLSLGIIWLTVVERSARRARRAATQWAAYLQSGAVLPDEARPPISVYAISRMLDLPYETTRRSVGRLISMGMLAKVRKGVISPAAFMDSARVRAANAELQARLRRWLIALDRQGLVRLAGGPAALWPSSAAASQPGGMDPYVDEARRKYSRLAIGFMIEAGRLVAAITDGNLLRGLLLVAIVQANVGRLSNDPERSQRFSDFLHPPPDEIRRPISIFALAQSLHLPYETVRRNILQMVAEGLVDRTRRGVTVPTAVVMGDRVVDASLAAQDLFRNFIRALAEAGLEVTLAD
jgi:predicted transcriptional regulator